MLGGVLIIRFYELVIWIRSRGFKFVFNWGHIAFSEYFPTRATRVMNLCGHCYFLLVKMDMFISQAKKGNQLG